MKVVTLLRKPLIGTVASNSLAHGTGGINVGASRIVTTGGTARDSQAPYPLKEDGTEDRSGSWARTGHGITPILAGRWPANLILADHMAAAVMDEQSGVQKSGVAVQRNRDGGPRGWIAVGGHTKNPTEDLGYGDTGGASRFFKQVVSQ